jgi:predicted Zn-ribbon and HTH transcriptional regulator
VSGQGGVYEHNGNRYHGDGREVDALPNRELLKRTESHASAAFIADLETLELRRMPLPGATVPRPWATDSRILLPQGAKSTDLITLYEHVATVRHRSSKKIFVIAQETIDCLYFQQQDPVKFPAGSCSCRRSTPNCASSSSR